MRAMSRQHVSVHRRGDMEPYLPDTHAIEMKRLVSKTPGPGLQFACKQWVS